MDRFHPYLGEYNTLAPGEGICPTGTTVRFRETFRLERIDDWVRYEQRAIDVATGRTLHHESGVFRVTTGDTLELALVMNSGRMELGTANWNGAELRTQSSTFLNDRLGVIANERRFTFSEDGCHKELWLATPLWPTLTRHMWGDLTRASEDGKG